MSNSALTTIAVFLAAVSLSGQSNGRIEQAVARIDGNDVTGLRRLLKEDPSLIRRTEAACFPPGDGLCCMRPLPAAPRSKS